MAGVIDHLRSELDEVSEAPGDVTEWADVIILALDGAWRAGHEPADLLRAVHDKAQTNRSRRWPDWRGVDECARIEHIRGIND